MFSVLPAHFQNLSIMKELASGVSPERIAESALRFVPNAILEHLVPLRDHQAAVSVKQEITA